jgi:hypothetical protein
MDKVHEPSYPESYTPSSEPFIINRFYLNVLLIPRINRTIYVSPKHRWHTDVPKGDSMSFHEGKNRTLNYFCVKKWFSVPKLLKCYTDTKCRGYEREATHTNPSLNLFSCFSVAIQQPRTSLPLFLPLLLLLSSESHLISFPAHADFFNFLSILFPSRYSLHFECQLPLLCSVNSNSLSHTQVPNSYYTCESSSYRRILMRNYTAQ